MEDLITNLSKSLGSFCNHLKAAATLLSNPSTAAPSLLYFFPLLLTKLFFFYFDNTFRDSDSASSTFVQCLNRRVSTATADLNLLESMSLDTVSFEELLGHCYQIFNNNQTHLLHLKNHLKPLGYLPFEIENDEEEEEVLDSNDRCFSVTNSAIKSLDEDPLLLDESMSLKNFGLSDVCLATLASQVFTLR
ncbi:hypothetical protein ES332_D06G161700v1 [Gossypium tomentosum]|uniref:Uncharacterized protein n=1 Tax=Gossypium tomentosum TaxID=34277 RepID=A0A5D2KCW5_GOSTO|nr:hypothetical protein ES332_D06G003600v1 [Gossypium tomentosum]TYH67054.1 hypothetical protein ES332_D06G161700v1 [Gossypium tomentosum]